MNSSITIYRTEKTLCWGKLRFKFDPDFWKKRILMPGRSVVGLFVYYPYYYYRWRAGMCRFLHCI